MNELQLEVDINNQFITLVENFFNNENTLLFSYVHLTEIFHSGISMQFVYTDDQKLLTDFFDLQCSILDKYKIDNRNITSFQEWFTLHNAIKSCIKRNPKEIIDITQFRWKHNFVSHDKKEFGCNTGISKTSIGSFINGYVSEIHKLILEKSQHALSILFPLYKIKNGNLLPYANLEIHVGTEHDVSESQINEFKLHLKSLWYELYGGYEIQNLNNEFSDFIKLNKNDVWQYLLPSLNTTGNKLNSAISAYLLKNNNLEVFEIKKNEFLGNLQTRHISGFGYLQDVPIVNYLVNNYNEIDIQNFIFRRAYSIYLLISKNMELAAVRRLILRNDPEELYTDDPTIIKNRLKYFNNALHLTLPTDDIDFYKNVKEYVRNSHTNFSSDKIKKIERFLKSLTRFEIDIISTR